MIWILPTLCAVTALEKIRPALLADGGDIELLPVVGRDAHVRRDEGIVRTDRRQVVLVQPEWLEALR